MEKVVKTYWFSDRFSCILQPNFQKKLWKLSFRVCYLKYLGNNRSNLEEVFYKITKSNSGTFLMELKKKDVPDFPSDKSNLRDKIDVRH